MDRKKKEEHIDIGYFDFPKDYLSFDEEKRKNICTEIIDVMLHQIDKKLPEFINRVDFLDEILVSSIITGEADEQYEVCQVLTDCRKILNE